MKSGEKYLTSDIGVPLVFVCCELSQLKANHFEFTFYKVASTNVHYQVKKKRSIGHSTKVSKNPFLNNLKRPASASKRDGLVLEKIQ